MTTITINSGNDKIDGTYKVVSSGKSGNTKWYKTDKHAKPRNRISTRFIDAWSLFNGCLSINYLANTNYMQKRLKPSEFEIV